MELGEDGNGMDGTGADGGKGATRMLFPTQMKYRLATSQSACCSIMLTPWLPAERA